MNENLKKSITKKEYLVLLGIKALADKAHSQIDAMIPIVAGILTTDCDIGGHPMDLVWSGEYESVDDFIRKFEIEIVDEASLDAK